MRIIARLHNLIRGVLANWIGRREHANPQAVYAAAIEERLQQYAKLRQAAAGVLYMRSKVAKELELRSAELTRVRLQLDLAVEGDDDEVALSLIARRGELGADVERLTAEVTEMSNEAETAKQNLAAFHQQITQLREEKLRMTARLAHAKARLHLHETVNGISVEADLRALDGVRDHVNRVIHEAQLSRELGDAALEKRLAGIRDAEAAAAARAQLDELKRTRKRRLLPVLLSSPARAV